MAERRAWYYRDTLSPDRYEWLKGTLIFCIVRYVGPSFVVTKLCVALAVYAFRVPKGTWPHFVQDVCELVASQISEQPLNRDKLYAKLLDFLKVVPEEATAIELPPGDKSRVNQALLEGMHPAIQVIQTALHYGLTTDLLHSLLQPVMHLIPHEETFEAAADAMNEIMSKPCKESMKEIYKTMLQFTTSEWIQAEYRKAIEEEDGDKARQLCRLVIALGENYDHYIADFRSDSVQAYLRLTIDFIRFPGYFAADQEVSDLPLNFWSDLQEMLYDEGRLPLTTYDYWDIAMTELYSNLVEVLVDKITYPPLPVFGAWMKDVKDRWRIFRRDVGDTLMCAYYILQHRMTDYLLQLVHNSVAEMSQEGSPATLKLEASLYAIKCLSEGIPSAEQDFLQQLFTSDLFDCVSAAPDVRLKATLVSLVGAYTEWFRNHPEYIVLTLNYVVQALSHPQTSVIAAMTFKTICDMCRKPMVDLIGSLVQTYNAVSRSIQPLEKQKIVESVAAVIEAVPHEHMLGALVEFTQEFFDEIAQALSVGKNEQAKAIIIDNFKYLTGCCRGLISPEDEGAVAEVLKPESERIVDKNGFSKDAHTAKLEASIYAAASNTLSIWVDCDDVVTATCQFLIDGLKTDHLVLAVPLEPLCQLISDIYNHRPHVPLLTTAAVAVATYGKTTHTRPTLLQLINNVSVKSLPGMQTTEDDVTDIEQFPEFASAYFGLLMRALKQSPQLVLHLTDDLLDAITKVAITGMLVQDRLALKTILAFLADLTTLTLEQDPTLENKYDALVRHCADHLMHTLILDIGGHAPRSVLGQLIDFLYRFVGRHVELSRQCLFHTLQTPGFPTPYVDNDDKELFVKSVLGTRSPKRFREAVQTFSSKARQLHGTAFGSAV
ncbi:hypothetical protein BZG36_03096 [Bifiguratus adelaidae]|uniref:Importin-13 n=1 Tax=Bifiguratus adelaidae TaxID=1938954 RepID=A0A261XYX3_9FUNG|nr:hypothetical protein BZG36_03096 [Bifiguratus adelaidae]